MPADITAGSMKTGLAGIDRAECDKLENYVVLWEIRGKMWLRAQK